MCLREGNSSTLHVTLELKESYYSEDEKKISIPKNLSNSLPLSFFKTVKSSRISNNFCTILQTLFLGFKAVCFILKCVKRHLISQKPQQKKLFINFGKIFNYQSQMTTAISSQLCNI